LEDADHIAPLGERNRGGMLRLQKMIGSSL